ncbi:MAG TPA: 2-oxoacid:acceptor oxidoreductase family protein [Thermoplasmata archaeon]|nr:2-oxoacid:acceptor oxidoreductase family protein [Thermoplasmata archaeon]HLA46378.1 2-oxoacid:acceptor oxidoreductase family protein [Thermoplasmata archaeon]
MLEVRFHGRGGQGSVIASELLAQAAFLEGMYPQSFPFFGVERRGAPVTAYSRIDSRPISVRTSITTPDIVVVLDSSLLRTVTVTSGLKPHGLLLLNSEGFPDQTRVGFSGRIATVDATGIALAHGLGSKSVPIVNTAILGAFARVSGVVTLESVLKAIEKGVPAKPDANREAAAEAFEQVRVLEAVVA